MSKIKKTIIFLALFFIGVLCSGCGHNEKIVKTVIANKNYYSEWKRLNEVFKAKKDTEKSFYENSETLTVTSDIELSTELIDVISIKIGYKIEMAISKTILGAISADLKKGEYTAFYYRKHWIEYVVILEDPLTGKISSTYISVAQNLTPDDYGWMYSYKGTLLAETLHNEYCIDDTITK